MAVVLAIRGWISGKIILFRPDDPLAPLAQVFDEPWQAKGLALADAPVKAGRFTAADWGEALGAALKEAESLGVSSGGRGPRSG